MSEFYLSKSAIDELKLEFIQSYDDDYWSVRISMMDFVLNNLDEFEDSLDYDREVRDHLQRIARSEYRYLFYHSTEALLSIVRSIASQGLTWIDVRETYTNDLYEFIDDSLTTDGILDDLRYVFYANSDLVDRRSAMDESIEFIRRYLLRIGDLYKSDNVYNEYKHGLRLMTSKSRIQIDIPGDEFDSEFLNSDSVTETETGVRWTPMDSDVLLYLNKAEWDQDPETGKKHWSLEKVISALEFDLYRRLSRINADLISQIFSLWRVVLNVDEGAEEEATIKIYDHLDIEDIFKSTNEMSKFTVGRYFPQSSEDAALYKV
ncbi:hypothetical protein [Halogranum rubrum]|uniref:Uncharacterized protein n=1 Tax=Halogranum salarium B-1 TaxID=1210908 RepID=J2ZIC4_9EURY|nr:hypothetical protein [Halogranum salarium]EJN60465.1 hypothetical protein HSB1_10680 [Halogranum salarium B-1]